MHVQIAAPAAADRTPADLDTVQSLLFSLPGNVCIVNIYKHYVSALLYN